MKESEDHPILDQLLVDAMKEGKSAEIAASMITPNITAAALYLRRYPGDGSPIPPKEQRHCVEAGNAVRLGAWFSAHKIADAILPGDEFKESRASLAGMLACQMIASIGAILVARACTVRDLVDMAERTAAHGQLILASVEKSFDIPKAPKE